MDCDDFYAISRENKMQQNLGLRSFPSILKVLPNWLGVGYVWLKLPKSVKEYYFKLELLCSILFQKICSILDKSLEIPKTVFIHIIFLQVEVYQTS